jgi:S-adenosylmethionine:tRNA ribosyltransferase-isomerase
MDVSLFDYELPEERIALRPAHPRDSARMLVVREDGTLTHAIVHDLPAFLRAGDTLVVNDSKVIPARLHAHKIEPGGAGPAVELLLHKRTAPDRFLALARPARKLHPGDRLHFNDGFRAQVCTRQGRDVEIAFKLAGAALDAAIAEAGEMPLPPYIARRRAADARDVEDYQTVFAMHEGSSAAPTAGLHFTPELLAWLSENGIAREQVTLHVGPGTFLPVNEPDTAAHRMHRHHMYIDAQTANPITSGRAGAWERVSL